MSHVKIHIEGENRSGKTITAAVIVNALRAAGVNAVAMECGDGDLRGKAQRMAEGNPGIKRALQDVSVTIYDMNGRRP